VALQAADVVAWHLRREHEYGPEKRRIASMIIDYAAGKDIDGATLEISARKMRRFPGPRHMQSKASWRAAKKEIQVLVNSGAPAPSINPLRLHMINVLINVRRAVNRFRRWRRSC
jgi:hypothetical protein